MYILINYLHCQNFKACFYFTGDQENSQEFVEALLTCFPKLRDAGGFELMRISGATRSRQLAVVPCPNEGYTVSYLKDPSTMINHATLFIRPKQRNLSLDHVRFDLLVCLIYQFSVWF